MTLLKEKTEKKKRKKCVFLQLSMKDVFFVLELSHTCPKTNKHQIPQGDREFEALSEAILAFPNTSVYSDEKISELISTVDFE
jgi:hypothetical protein